MGSEDGFFRVAFGTRPDTIVVVSRESVEVLDLKVGDA